MNLQYSNLKKAWEEGGMQELILHAEVSQRKLYISQRKLYISQYQELEKEGLIKITYADNTIHHIEFLK